MWKCLQILCLALGAASACLPSDAAANAFAAAERAARAGDSLRAYLLYAQAERLAPGNSRYARKRAALQGVAALSRPAQLGPVEAPGQTPERTPTQAPNQPMDPAIETVEATMKNEGIVESLELAAEPPPALTPSPGRQSFDLKGSAQTLFEKVAGAYGIQVTFDAAYVQPAASVTFRITDATAPEALRALEAATDSFLTPLGERRALVARDNAQKRTELMPVMAVAAPIPERLSLLEAQEITTAVQQTLEIRRISLDAAKRVVYFRDIVPKALAARQMFASLSRGRAQIEVDVEFVSVGRTSNLSYGLALPNAGAIIDFGKSFLNVPAVASPVGFLTFGGGGTLLGLGIANAAVFATLSKSSTETLLNSQIVALDGQAATLHVGDRYPVITASFSAGASGQAQLPQSLAPSVQFVDLGLVLKITPTIHDDMEVTLDVDAQFKGLGGTSVNGIPVINSQQYQGKVRLKDDEWAVIAGLVSTSDSQTPTGVLGLSNLPWIGGLFTHHVTEHDRSDTLVVLKPHLVSLPPWEYVTPALWPGTETRPVMPF
jgi:general secretion pathway protein D